MTTSHQDPQPSDPLPFDPERPVTEADIASAMAVDAMPDETRTHGHADETDQTITSAGEVAEVEGDHLSGHRVLADQEQALLPEE